MKTKRRKLISACFILLIIIFIVYIAKLNSYQELELTQLSAETNDGMMGYVIRTKRGKTIVIDGGRDADADKLIENIKKYSDVVDYWIITHPHKDHAGAFISIVNNENINIDIKNIYYTVNSMEWYNTYESNRAIETQNFYEALKNEKIVQNLNQPNIGDEIDIEKNLKIQILGIRNEEITDNAINNSSMVFKVCFNDKTMLFLGDTGEESSRKLEKMYGEKLKSDIVQLSHHGQNGATKELYELVSPQICFWPTPVWLWNNDSGNGYNSGIWATIETREWIENLGVETNYIAKDGDITVTLK